MIEKDPSSYPFITYLWVFSLALIGGLINFLRKLEKGHAHLFNLAEVIGELVTSAFTGVLVFWFCEGIALNPLFTAGLVGIAGHMGSRGLYLIEDYLKEKAGLKD